MSKVALVTDSTAYIPAELVKKHHITVAPQVLVWGDETFRDGVDILPDEFYSRLSKAKIMPTTSQVTPGTFLEIYMRLMNEGYEVLTVLISQKLSGTMASALQAKEMLPKDAPVEIIDSHTTTMAMGYMVLEAARAAEGGATLKECSHLVEAGLMHAGAVFAVDTLEFLHRGGRIGNGTRFLGTALNIKPILEVVDGLVEPIERVRTRSRSLSRLLELAEDRVGDVRPLHISTLHANAYSDACSLLDQVNGKFNASESIVSEVSPVVGTHTGPGTVGIAWMAGI